MNFADKPSFYEIVTGHRNVSNCGSGCGGGRLYRREEERPRHGCGGGCGALRHKTVTSCGGWGGGSCGAPTHHSCGPNLYPKTSC